MKHAFPSCRRDILFSKLGAIDGVPDSLIRALWAAYEDSKPTIRSDAGFSDIFDILLGTKEGGVESPLLFLLMAHDLIDHLERIEFSKSSVFIAGREVRALQLADDLVLLPHSAEDLQALIDSWGNYCDKNHQQTQVSKTEAMVFTYDGDSLSISQGISREQVYK